MKISDQVTANDKEIDVTLTLNVNEAASVMPGANVATVGDYDHKTKLYTINATLRRAQLLQCERARLGQYIQG